MRNPKGITLISLSITILVLIILTTTFAYNINSYVENRKASNIKADLQKISELVEHYYAENKKLPILNQYANLQNVQNLNNVISSNDNDNYYVVDLKKLQDLDDLNLSYGVDGYKQVMKKEVTEEITNITDIFIINEQSHIVYYPEGVTIYDDIIYRLDEEISETQNSIPDIKIDGSWNENKNVNSPKLKGTGLTAIYWDENGNEIELTNDSKASDWSNWYDYDNQKWANAITKDENGRTTGYFVWIPRYAYKITSGLGTATQGEIEVVFIDINNKNGDITYSEVYPTVDNNAMTDFVVHPAFTTDIENGGWDENIEGFWIAKYQAGYQSNTITVYEDGSLSTTISNTRDTVVYSDKRYTNVNSMYTSNALGQTLTENETKITYPVFKPLTYAYNNISTSDSYTISREIQNATNFYGLNNIDSHMLKNSEWGAVVYLTHSSYGRDGEEVNINNYYTSESSPFKTSITGIYADSIDESATNAISTVYAYNTEVGVKGSSTANIYGVYDLSGGLWDKTTSLIYNGNANLNKYGSSLLNNGVSSKYVTVYPSDDEGITDLDIASRKNYEINTQIYGDAIRETSAIGETSWYGDNSSFPANGATFFIRGHRWLGEDSSGMFGFGYTSGESYAADGFRIVLVAE